MGASNKHFYEFDCFRLDPAQHILLRDGQIVPLTPKVFETLLVLVESNGHVVDKDELLQQVWKDTFVEETNLTKNISVLRKILSENDSGGSFIETIPKRGYRFIAEVLEIGIESPEKAREPQKSNLLSSRNPKIGLTAIMVLLAFLIGLIYWFYGNNSSNPVNIKQIESIAVLPFTNESGDANLDYLSDGLSESVIDRLSQLPQLKVIARNSSFKYRGNNLDLQEIGNALGVQVIVMGRVIQRDDNLLVRVEIIDIHDNIQIWGGQFNRKTTETFSAQQEIAQTVSEKLRLKLSGVQETQLTKRETNDVEAFEAVLKGKFYANKAHLDFSLEDEQKAVEYYQQAIARDPNYALAYVGLSGLYKSFAARSQNPKEISDKALAAALKALELDENLAEAHVALANLKRNAWQWDEAERGYKRALELNPNLVGAHHGYSVLLSFTGRHEHSIAEARLARNLDPLSPVAMDNLANRLYFARRYDEAIEVIKQMLEMDQNKFIGNYFLGEIYSTKGMHSEALSAYQKAGKLEDKLSDDVYLGRAFARSGNSEKARAMLKRLQTSRKRVSHCLLAVLFTALGDREQALASLEKAYTEHDGYLVYVNVDPAFDSLRDDPRFQDLIRRIGFPE